MTDTRQPIGDVGGKCPDFEVLSCYADGELEGEALADVARHAQACGRCAHLAARLRDGFEAGDAARDGGIGGSGCAGEEVLVLYAGGGVRGGERAALDAHLATCDACVRSVALLHRRLAMAPSVAAPVPTAVRRRAEAALSVAPAAAVPAAPVPASRPGLFERLTHWLRVPVLVPAAAAAALLLTFTVLPRGPEPSRERSRALAPTALTLRVRVVEADVHARPSGNSTVLATVRRGTALAIAGEERDWYEVRLEDGAPGWIAREAFE